MKKIDYRHGGLEKISAKTPKKNEPKAVQNTAKQDLRVKGG